MYYGNIFLLVRLDNRRQITTAVVHGSSMVQIDSYLNVDFSAHLGPSMTK